MDKEYFLNTGIQPPLQFEPTMHAWNNLTSAHELNCSPSDSHTSSCYPNWDKQAYHHNAQMESALTSMVSSPVAPNSPHALALRELIRKLNSGEIPAAPSCYTTPLNSPPSLQVPNLRNSMPVNPAAVPALSVADPGFAERAAKFSCFGSRSFNCRTSQFGQNNVELPITMGNGKLPRVSSSPLLNKPGGSPFANKNLSQTQMEMRPANGLVPASDKRLSNKLPAASDANSNEESSVSDQVPSANELNSRKRKAVARGKPKEDATTQAVNANKEAEPDADANAKRSKLTEVNVSENCGVKTEDEAKGSDDNKANQKPPEPQKDYIHVRARRGQATDSHSLAERVRREKISERMKLLQDLVPGCNKVTGKALMLDEIINYVQSLQRQVEFLSMKLASVDPRLDNMDNLLSKDVYQPNASLPQPLFSVDSSEPALYKNQPEQGPQPRNSGSVDYGDTLCHDLGLHLPPLDGLTDGIAQFPPFCEDDLQSIVRMGYSQIPDREAAPFYSQTFPVANQASHMKIEL